MKLQTQIPIQKIAHPISYDAAIVSIGSCFAVHMAEQLKNYQFRGMVNPFGILFHPMAIEKLFQFATQDKVFTAEDIFEYDEIWSSFDAHSDLNELDAETLLDNLNVKLTSFKNGIKEATHLILTLGTAWVYRNVENGEIVANCHKVPQKAFKKEILSVNDIQGNLERIQECIKKLNPSLQIIYTLSPVRHIKDGYVENQRSKAHLITALQGFLEAQTDSCFYYFPSYELMMDELRDYRFYKADMLHPNELALQYIWEKFVVNCIAEESGVLMHKVEEVQKGLAHRPFNPYSEKHQQFLDNLAQKLDDLLERYPFMNFR